MRRTILFIGPIFLAMVVVTNVVAQRSFALMEIPGNAKTHAFNIDNKIQSSSLIRLPDRIKLEVADTFHVDVVKYWRIAFGKKSADRVIPHLYQFSNDITIDGEWIDSHDHFAVWDSRKVNPYKFDPVKYKDTVQIALKTSKRPWISPITDDVVLNSKFGMRRYRWHYGVDLDLERGDTVVAVADGVVRVAQYDRYGYGHYVVLRHKNGLETLYGHFLKRGVRVGQEIKQGEFVGLGGSTGRSTGYHLHFEVRYKGAAINPTELFDFENKKLNDDVFELTPESFVYIKEIRKKRYHRIRSGDTLSRISRRYRTSINAICRLNGISRSKVLKIGRTLRVK